MIYERHNPFMDGFRIDSFPSSQGDTPLISRNTHENFNTTQDQSSIIQFRDTTLSNESLESRCGIVQSVSPPLCTRISTLCKREFRYQPWYMGNMFSLMSVMLTMAAFILPMAQSSRVAQGQIIFPLACTPICLLCVMMIPLGGIQDNLEPKQPAHRHPLSVVRLLIDPGKYYHISRCIFFAYCPISILPFSATAPSSTVSIASYRSLPITAALPPSTVEIAKYLLIPSFISCAICCFVFFSALFMGLWSIFKQLYNEK